MGSIRVEVVELGHDLGKSKCAFGLKVLLLSAFLAIQQEPPIIKKREEEKTLNNKQIVLEKQISEWEKGTDIKLRFF